MKDYKNMNSTEFNKLKQKLFSITSHDRDEIEKNLKIHLDPAVEIVAQIAGHLLFAGGKRIRPLLLVLCARICGYDGRFDKLLSVALEYLHTATLLHDDVVDCAKLRRGKPVANSVWNTSMVILTGDFLFAKAGSLTSELENIEIEKMFSILVQKMAQGEIYQLLNKGRMDIPEEEYFDIIHYKTGAMIETACRAGSLLADAPEEKAKALTVFGNKLGTIFQMVDDMLDYTAVTKGLGKNVGADLREGKQTLPVIYALTKANDEDRLFMKDVINNKDFTVDQFEQFRKLLIKYKGIEYTRTLAEQYALEAVSALSVFDDSETKRALLMVVDYFLGREE